MNDEFSFMNEKIKEKPFYKKKWVQILTGILGVVVLTVAVSWAVFMKMHARIEEQQVLDAIQNVEIPEDKIEDSAEAETIVTEKLPPETIMVENEITLEDYSVLYAQLRGLAKEAKRSVVTVTAVSNDVDWFNETYQSRGQASGMIIGDNGVELLIVTKYTKIENCDGMQVTFVDNTVVPAVLKKYDMTTGLAVISVNLSDISEETRGKIMKATLGNSTRIEAGTPILAVGRADGSGDSLKIGTLTSVNYRQSVMDTEYTIFVTDMSRTTGADGVLVNLNGEVIGIIQEQYLADHTQNVLSAYAISDMKSLLEHLSNNQDITYLGVKGVAVTAEAQNTGVPAGIYVTEVVVDSPAMRGGIQAGDVLEAINGQVVSSLKEFSEILQRLSNKQNVTLEGYRFTKEGYKKVNYQTALSVLE